MRRRVVITGVGCVNPLGHDVETMWSALRESKSGVGYTSIFDASKFPTRISAEVKNWDIAQEGEDSATWAKRGRHTRFACGAAKQAVRASGLLDDKSLDPVRFGVYLGCGEGSQDFLSFATMMTSALTPDGLDLEKFTKTGMELLDPWAEMEQEPNMPSGYVAGMFGAQGPNFNCLTACAASSQAIGEATEIIRRGDADVMLSGGAHSMIHPFGVTGFNLLTALSTSNDAPEKASRPFDRLRDGFVLGEGGAMVVLEDLEHAKRRGAPILGEILGYGTTADAYRITDIHPEGRGAIACMKMAINDAKLNPSDIGYVNAHGTSTSVNDRVESLACKTVFAERAMQTPVSSTKSMMGHLIAAAGVTELIVCLLAIRDGVLPPTINYENPDPDCDLDYIPNVAREAKLDVALSNSFGFGGQNISLVAGRFKG
ncbi:Beta-ketoacyl synthase [Pirellula staleyi DSM 6068]|uniref:3-oxoacyl-[acyl-carrier-protein] synthase 2 n=1 Tax=Pirellula staleyi (strain ATCC 27377 / DSM 6068 / ICPB 4128) TaxID=530564 RepID=D2QY51_PIRSD|nr:beta-ketoacyl-[acyl-carrier-protein] synthase family protein [Pirellula staleyi]ADB16265.1 Beta-ketoacyl synthase [Pirellula staleyi DSM 6068]